MRQDDRRAVARAGRPRRALREFSGKAGLSCPESRTQKEKLLVQRANDLLDLRSENNATLPSGFRGLDVENGLRPVQSGENRDRIHREAQNRSADI